MYLYVNATTLSKVEMVTFDIFILQMLFINYPYDKYV